MNKIGPRFIPKAFGRWAHVKPSRLARRKSQPVFIFIQMATSCYILYSRSLGKFYVGATRTSIEDRLILHAKKVYGQKSFTASATDWELYLNIPTQTYEHALRLEKHIKSMKSRKYIENLKKYPELIEKILDQTATK